MSRSSNLEPIQSRCEFPCVLRYVPHPTKTFGGRKVWKRIDMDSDPIVLWYWPRKKVWMMTRLSNVGGEQAYAAVRDSADNPADITRQWLVYDPIQKKHRLDQNVKVHFKIISVPKKCGFSRAVFIRFLSHLKNLLEGGLYCTIHSTLSQSSQ